MYVAGLLVAVLELSQISLSSAVHLQDLAENKGHGSHKLGSFTLTKTHNITTPVLKRDDIISLSKKSSDFDHKLKSYKRTVASPKRTIQKIVKKVRPKRRRVLHTKVTVFPSHTSEISHVVEEEKDKTTHAPRAPKKKLKKFKPSRYPIPFRNLNKNGMHHRMRRDAQDVDYFNTSEERDTNDINDKDKNKFTNEIDKKKEKYEKEAKKDLNAGRFLFEDFDEAEVQKDEDGNAVVTAHFKNLW